jgi:uncharacterized membrane protein YraQ (UPF0718 family)
MKEAVIKSANNFKKILPMMLGTILLISLIYSLTPQNLYSSIFRNNLIIDPIIGALIGSISTGSAMISYILGGELLSKGVSLSAVTAFLVAWVTIGIIQFPFEANILGKKFAFWRNLTAFVLAIVVGITVTLIFKIF